MIFNFKLHVNWDQVLKKRDKLAIRDNARETSKRLSYKYTVGEKILIVLKVMNETEKSVHLQKVPM